LNTWGAPLPDGLEQASDSELARLSRGGSEPAFAEIVRRYSPRIFRVASRFFRRREQVEEAAQEVFLRAFMRLGDYEGRGSLEGWLTRGATTTCLNLIRGARRRPEVTISDLTDDEGAWLDEHAGATRSEPSVEDRIVAADLAERVLETLSPDERLVLTLVDGEQTPVKDVAEATGWSESNVKVRAFRARRRARAALEKLLAGVRKDRGAESKARGER
jgi:RNA polymerase sigma factor (sigma-70 family)